jgi:hypothetical protein
MVVLPHRVEGDRSKKLIDCLLYQLVQGPVEKTIIERCYKERLPLPEAIQNAPQLILGLELYYRAFFELNTCRQVGWVEGDIPWTAIDQWARSRDLSEEQREDLHHLIRQMDLAFLKHRAKKRKDTEPKGKGKQK